MNIFGKLLGKQDNTYPFRDLNSRNVTAGLITGLMAVTGPPVLILEAASNGGFSTTQIILWMFACYVFGGLYGILLPLYYRIPIVGAHTITGVAFLATVTGQFSYYELVGAYIFSGLLMLLVGYFGAFKKLINFIPKEIIAAMLAGMITQYLVNFIVSINQLSLIGIFSLIVYFIFSRWNMKVPPIIAAIGTGFILLLITEPIFSGGMSSPFVVPNIQVPEFSLLSFLSVSIPLALLILSNDAAVGVGALEQNNFKPPINQIISLSGIFSMITSFFGGQSANIGGMMTAICSDEDAGPKEKRYMGAVFSGMILLLFGIFAWKLVPFIQSLPQAFVSILVGFALLGVFANSLQLSFSKPSMKMSVVFTFVIALSNITFFNISAPIWSLIIGTFIAKYIEKQVTIPEEEKVNQSA